MAETVLVTGGTGFLGWSIVELLWRGYDVRTTVRRLSKEQTVRAAMLGHKHDVTSAKAQRMLGWKPRPAATAILDCAESLFGKGAA